MSKLLLLSAVFLSVVLLAGFSGFDTAFAENDKDKSDPEKCDKATDKEKKDKKLDKKCGVIIATPS